jgi:hypothetical protein
MDAQRMPRTFTEKSRHPGCCSCNLYTYIHIAGRIDMQEARGDVMADRRTVHRKSLIGVFF